MCARDGEVLDCWEQSTVHGDDVLWTTKTMLPPYSEDGCIVLGMSLMSELAGVYHGVFHPYFHPVNLGGRGAVPTARWFERVLEEAQRLGMPAPGADEWLDFNDARRSARIEDVVWDKSADTLHFRISTDLPVEGLTVLLPRHAGVAPASAEVNKEAAPLRPVHHERLNWTALEIDLAANTESRVTVAY